MLKSRVEVVKIDDCTDDQVEKVVYVIHEQGEFASFPHWHFPIDRQRSVRLYNILGSIPQTQGSGKGNEELILPCQYYDNFYSNRYTGAQILKRESQIYNIQIRLPSNFLKIRY